MLGVCSFAPSQTSPRTCRILPSFSQLLSSSDRWAEWVQYSDSSAKASLVLYLPNFCQNWTIKLVSAPTLPISPKICFWKCCWWSFYLLVWHEFRYCHLSCEETVSYFNGCWFQSHWIKAVFGWCWSSKPALSCLTASGSTSNFASLLPRTSRIPGCKISSTIGASLRADYWWFSQQWFRSRCFATSSYTASFATIFLIGIVVCCYPSVGSRLDSATYKAILYLS